MPAPLATAMFFCAAILIAGGFVTSAVVLATLALAFETVLFFQQGQV